MFSITTFKYTLITILILISSSWAFRYFGLSCFEQIIYHIKVPLKGTNLIFIGDWLKMCLCPSLLISIPIAFILPLGLVFLRLILIISIIASLYRTGFFGFIGNIFRQGQIYEDHYIDPRSAKIIPPKEKKNLIHIYMESMEDTYFPKKYGGNSSYELLPKLTQLALNNTHFSNHEGIGGCKTVSGTGWTTGAMAAAECGIPLLLPLSSLYITKNTPLCPGASSIGEILSKDGYSNTLLIGSDAVFGGRYSLFKTHGNYDLIDYPYALNSGLLAKDYHKFWGFEDDKLYEFAKKKVLELAASDRPFNLTMLTVDTHHPGGYQGETCGSQFKEPLSNSINHADSLVSDFLEFLKEQEFYEDTVIVIHGDHTSMAAQYIHRNYDKGFDRRVFNTFINAAKSPVNSKNRQFTTFDYFPTILSALGYEIKGNRLALGTDLFSESKTVAEKKGFNYIDRELRKKSKFYRENIIKRPN